MQIIYLNHSSFLLKLNNTSLLIDYGTRPLRPTTGKLEDGVFEFERNRNLPNLVGYSSHRHADHIDEKLIKEFISADKPFILSDEPNLEIKDYMQDPNFYRLLPQTLTEVAGLKIANTGSTDQGGSILFQEMDSDFSIYFGADLAVWDDFSEFYDGFALELDWLAQIKSQFSKVKVVFLPSGTGDGYQEKPLLDGAMQIIKLFQPELVIPIHGADYPEYYPGFVKAMQQRFDKIDTGTFSEFEQCINKEIDFQVYYPEKSGEAIEFKPNS